LVLLWNGLLYSGTGLLGADAQSLGLSSQAQLIGMILLMTLMPMWLLACFIVTQRNSLAMALKLDERLASAVIAIPGRYVLAGFAGGLIYALVFNVPTDQVDRLLSGDGPMIAIFCGQVLIWVCVGLLLSIRLYVGNQFYRLGSSIDISLFEQSRLQPFARVGMLDVAIAVGCLAIATVQSIDAQFRLDNYLTALLVALPAAAALLVRPMWTLHQRLVRGKQQLLEEVRQQIERAPERGDSADVAALELLLARRDRVRALHTWPLDIAFWSRLVFYGLIPPLAWSAAALVEVLIEKMLGL
jgi:hypothetical protein